MKGIIWAMIFIIAIVVYLPFVALESVVKVLKRIFGR